MANRFIDDLADDLERLLLAKRYQAPNKLYRFHEYGWRLAYITPPLILWSLTLKRFRRWRIVAAVGALIAAGAAIPYGPWWMLKHLPIFRDLRVPSRYTIMFVVAFPILCGAALTDISQRMKRGAVALAACVVAVAALDGLAFDWSRLGEIPFTPETLADRSTPFYQVEGQWRTMMDDVLQNHGVISCSEEAPLQRADHLDMGDASQLQFSEADAGSITSSQWSPNRITASVSLTRPALLLVNENWNEHWKTTLGGVVKFGEKYRYDDDGGRLAVELPAGAHEFTVYYRPTSSVLGSVVTGTSLLLVLALWLRRQRLRRRIA